MSDAEQTPDPPLFHEPFQQPFQNQPVVVQTPPSSDNSQPKPKGKLLLIIGIVAGLELLIIIGLFAAVIANSDKSANPSSKKDGASVSSQVPSAATATGIQMTNDSISQDISSLNEDKDFPADKLSDKALGL